MRLLGRGKSLQSGLTICCLIAFVLFGYDQGLLGGILENQDFQVQFNYPSDSETGIIVSCYNLGCFAGCIGEVPLRFLSNQFSTFLTGMLLIHIHSGSNLFHR